MKLRWQLALTLAAIAAAATTVGSIAAYRATESQLRSEADEFLDERLDQVTSAGAFFDGNSRFGPFGDPERFGNPFANGEGFGPGFGFVQPDADTVYLNADGTVRASLSTVSIPPNPAELDLLAAGTGRTSRDVEISDRTYRVLTAPLDEGNPSAGGVQLARDISEIEIVLGRLNRRLLLIATVVTALAAAVGWMSSKRLARPLEHLRAATADVATSKDLNTALPVQGNAEVAEVTQSFNEMMAELAASQRRQHQLVLDANHELRTPIATLSANLQLLDALPDDSPERTDILAEAHRELAELTALADQLAASSTVQYRTTETAVVDLPTLVAGVVSDFKAKTGRTVPTHASDPALINADADLLGRALLNLLSNADKYSPSDRRIEVAVVGAHVTIRDHGPGFDPTDIPQIFDPFYRADSARSQPGSGLGLSLTKRIIESFGGTITATNHDDGGALVTVSLPPA